MSPTPPAIRKAAAHAIENLVRQQGDIVPWSALAEGFEFNGQKILFANRAKGIFKPALLNDGAALSVKSSRPSREGRSVKYNDEIVADGLLRYCFRDDGPESADNRLLLEAWKKHLPLIYLNGLADAVYQIFFPVFITQYDPIRKEVQMAWETDDNFASKDFLLNDPHHSLGKRTAVNQLQHARFRANVLAAYRFSCAFSHLSVGSMLRATSLIDPKNVVGMPAVKNAICMSVFHQTAFDANLIGITPKGEVKTSRLLHTPQNATLRAQLGLVANDGWKITLPKLSHLRPDPDCLNERFKLFQAANG